MPRSPSEIPRKMRNMQSSIHIDAVLNRARLAWLDPEHAMLADHDLRLIPDLHPQLAGCDRDKSGLAVFGVHGDVLAGVDGLDLELHVIADWDRVAC